MNELVFVKNDEAVTDSLTVAGSFGKRHSDVLRDIKILECSNDFAERNFALSEYNDKTGRALPKYYIKQDGFTFLVMGYTGKKAAEFKEKYINEFRRMEKQLNQPQPLSERDQLISAMKLSIESNERMDGIEEEVGELKTRFDNELTLNHGQATTLNHAIKKRIEKLFSDGVMGTLDTKHQMYSHIHSQLRRAFQAPTYREVKRVDYDDAIQWVSVWRPL
ncbi:Rha family transcriptional regulator [Tuberibacillus sp. Marseille-P3662]|uniref:Rha family transcriptional regulator n=1 Tax=Tuberibacillus sp. Marseille-P3662 TaxID=1965358 RepID=UPI000A1CAF36|nr:Rha family transcriptional regulator [Tuberibacillus sp. Marseille-P3662]